MRYSAATHELLFSRQEAEQVYGEDIKGVELSSGKMALAVDTDSMLELIEHATKLAKSAVGNYSRFPQGAARYDAQRVANERAGFGMGVRNCAIMALASEMIRGAEAYLADVT